MANALVKRRALVCALHSACYLLILAGCVATGNYFVGLGYTDAVNDGFFWVRTLIGLGIVAAAPWLIRDNGDVSEFFLHLIVLLIVTPSMALYAGSDSDWLFVVITITSYMIVALVARSRVSLTSISLFTPTSMAWTLLVAVILYFVALIVLGQAEFVNFDPMRVYDLRREAAANLPYIFGYFLPWTGKVAVTAGLALSLYKKNWLLFFLFCVASLGVFVFGAHKEPLLFPFIVSAAFLFFGRKEYLVPFLVTAVVGSGVLMLDAHLLYLRLSEAWIGFPGSGMLADYILRRGIMAPSALNELHIEFFGGEGHPYWWSTSRITFGLMESPYILTAPFKIGEIYFGNPEMSANAGWIGSGYANGLWVGAAIYSAMLGLLLALVDGFSRKTNKALMAGIFVVPLLALIISADFFTSLLTHGLALTIALAFLLRSGRKGRDRP